MVTERIWARLLLGLLLLVPLGLWFPSPGLAASLYYVAPDGRDTNPGTFQQPFATLHRAISQVQAGDTVYVRGGTYILADTLKIEVKGSTRFRTVFRSYPGEVAVLDCSRTSPDSSCIRMSGQYIDFKGFEVRQAQGSGISVWGGAHIRLQGNVVHDSQRGGIYVGRGDSTTVTDILIEANKVFANCQVNNPPPAGDGSGWPAAIGVSRATDATVRDNLVYENYGEGIGFLLVDYGLAVGNRVHDNYSVGMYMDNASHVTFQANLIYTTGQPAFFRYGGPANGIQMANEAYAEANPLDHNRVLNNIVVGGRHGFYYGSYGNGGGLKNTLVANNTFYLGQVALMHIDPDIDHEKTVLVNNVFYQTGDRPLLAFDGNADIVFHHNSWFGGEAGAGAGAGDITADPQLLNPGGLTAEDYRLRPGSPLIDAGVAVDNLASDYFGHPRPAGDGYDIGAHEWQP